MTLMNTLSSQDLLEEQRGIRPMANTDQIDYILEPQRFAALNLLEENVDNLTENMNGTLIDTAYEVLGKSKKKRV